MRRQAKVPSGCRPSLMYTERPPDPGVGRGGGGRTGLPRLGAGSSGTFQQVPGGSRLLRGWGEMGGGRTGAQREHQEVSSAWVRPGSPRVGGSRSGRGGQSEAVLDTWPGTRAGQRGSRAPRGVGAPRSRVRGWPRRSWPHGARSLVPPALRGPEAPQVRVDFDEPPVPLGRGQLAGPGGRAGRAGPAGRGGRPPPRRSPRLQTKEPAGGGRGGMGRGGGAPRCRVTARGAL